MSVGITKCTMKGCNAGAVDVRLGIALCERHQAIARRYLETIRAIPKLTVKSEPAKVEKPVVKKKAKPAKAPAKKVLKEDSEIEQVVLDYLGKGGQALVETILDKYDVKKGEHPTKTARVVAVMKALAEKDPSLEIVGVGADSRLRRKAQQETPAP